MISALSLGLVAVAAARQTPWHKLNDNYSFEDYEREFSRSYAPSERKARQHHFEQRLVSILEHNAGSHSWRKGVNQFTDRFPDELAQSNGLDKSLLHHSKFKKSAKKSAPTAYKFLDVKDLPSKMDWRDRGVITPVKNQGSCGSCWAFASTETAESHWALHTGDLQELSEQFILDCVGNPDKCGGTGGCFGGIAELAYDGLTKLGGMPSEWSYPYISGRDLPGKCHGLPLKKARSHTGAVSAAAIITGHVSMATNNYTEVMNGIANIGPMAVSVDATAWRDYESGVFDGGNMTSPDLDHLVQMVGYGTDSDGDYWLIRNSWTPLWGEHGYMKLARFGDAGDEPCGLDVTPLDGNGCEGGPPEVTVCGQSGVLYDAVYPTVV